LTDALSAKFDKFNKAISLDDDDYFVEKVWNDDSSNSSQVKLSENTIVNQTPVEMDSSNNSTLILSE
jgi:hypothetical protein